MHQCQLLGGFLYKRRHTGSRQSCFRFAPGFPRRHLSPSQEHTRFRVTEANTQTHARQKKLNERRQALVIIARFLRPPSSWVELSPSVDIVSTSFNIQ